MFRLKITACFLSMMIVLAPSLSGCQKKSGKKTVLSDQPLAEFQIKLLEQAFETATAIPVYPQIKPRSKAQALVVSTCLKMDQPTLAKKYCPQIDINNWCRGQAYAELADYCVEHHWLEEARFCLNHVREVVNKIEEKLKPDQINWRRDHLNTMIASIQEKIEQRNQANQKAAHSSDDEINVSVFDQQMNTLDAIIETGDFEASQRALFAYAELFERFYGNPDCRTLAEEKIKTSWDKIPIPIRLDLLLALSQTALDHADQGTALRIVNDAQVFIDDFEWPLELYVPRAAEVAKMRFLAGDHEQARIHADKIYELYVEKGSAIVNVNRSDALLPLAEAYQAIGNTEISLSIYKKAIEEGIVNINSKPRAEDLSAACCSMAFSEVEPDAELWARIRQIHEGLSDPW